MTPLPVANPSALSGVFVTATGTGVGKTTVSRALVRALRRRGLRVAGLKPIETGCVPCPADAVVLAEASDNADLAMAPAWYRAELPLAPYAVELSTGQAPPNLAAIADQTHRIARDVDLVVVEGAGGLLVPLDRSNSIADLALALRLPLLLVADDQLGVLSHVLSAVEVAERRGLPIRAIVLNRAHAQVDELSRSTNARILRERVSVPVVEFTYAPALDDLEALVSSAEASGLPELIVSRDLPRT